MDCARDAAEIEQAARSVAAVEAVRVSAATQTLSLVIRTAATGVMEVERAVAELGYRLERMVDPTDFLPSPARHVLAPGYTRTLWIVVLLNVGYGVVEMVGGVLSRSQALKSDALDFLGDGLITFLGIVAVGWGLRRRAQAALIQGVFLGALGVSVLLSTAYRVVSRQQPEAEVMGLLGAIALAVNVAAAMLLIPHRGGDANARAVWLFSRNDAIGNGAVMVAAVLVAWTETPWPDLLVSVAIAALFLHSAWQIVRDSRTDLLDAEP